jgi:hypothetical protein
MPPTRFPSQTLRIAGLLLVVFVTADPVRADFKATWQNASPAQTLSVYYDSNGAAAGGGQQYNNVLTGQYNWQWTSGDEKPGNINANNQFWTYCIELTQNVNNNSSVTYNLAPLDTAPDPGRGIGGGMGITKANMVQELFERNYTMNFNAVQAAAFQLALWEIIFEHGTSASWSITSGDFRLTTNNSTIAGLAGDMLNSVRNNGNGNYTGPRQWGLMAMTSGDSQDQVVVTPTPAPPGLVLALSGLLPGVVCLRRMRRVRPAA